MKFQNSSPYPDSPVELLKAIADWNALDLPSATHDDLAEILKRIFPIITLQTHRSDGLLHRIRKGPKLTTEADLWAPKKQQPSRVSTETKRVLYTSRSVPVAVIEAEVEIGEEFNYIAYRPKAGEAILMNYVLTDDFIDEGFEGSDWIYLKIQKNFFDAEFQRHVGLGNEFQYKASQHLCWNLLDVPTVGLEPKYNGREADGFMYLSVAHFRKAWNVAIKADVDSASTPFGVKKLEIECVQRCVRARPDGNADVIAIFPYEESRRIEDGKIIYDIQNSPPMLSDGRIVHV